MEDLQVKMKVVEAEDGGGGGEPVSPTGQYFNSSAMSISILIIFESDEALDDSQALAVVEKLFLPISPRFSSIIIKDENGVQQWKRVNVRLEDHVKTAVFPAGHHFYDEFVGEYLSTLALEQLPLTRPLWEIHLLKYRTRASAATAVFKLHHALGDGFSLMGALFSCLKRADNPSLPLTFPTARHSPPAAKAGAFIRLCRRAAKAFEVGVNTVSDFAWAMLKSTLLDDDRTPVRSGDPGPEFRPLTVSTVVFSLQNVRKIKDMLGGTINDVITGVIFYGIQLYMHSTINGHHHHHHHRHHLHEMNSCKKVTALVLLNTRIVNGYQSVEEMKRPGTKNPWGNQFAFIPVSLPSSGRGGAGVELSDPLSFVLKGRQIIRAKRNSFGVLLTGKLLEAIRRHRGPEVAAAYMHRTLRKTSMTISNLTGPIEQMIMGNNPISNFYFMVVGSPQSLSISVVSYMGKLTLAMGTEKGFIDSELLVSSMEKSFQRIFDAAIDGLNIARYKIN
ncbi:O-acyltransferase WSD1 [Apostasia shenzhenica]|uniref:O-acyltransferase WSD1 n=1 Tax=Apostasia shenzhenica TaxID=1088818 RepID=A0A2I0A805_9ASPA|nr:O-acyltransferase WSD1 [Apostasia shenzhenica]